MEAAVEPSAGRSLRTYGNLAWLAMGLLASLLSVGGRWSIPLAAWAAPVFLLRFSRTSRPATGIVGVAAVSFLQMVWMGFEWAVDLGANAVSLLLVLMLGVIFISPYVLDRMVIGRLRTVGRILLFPAAWAAMEFAVGTILPVGTSVGMRAWTQSDNLALVQVISLTGPYAIGFLIAMGATVANHIWEAPARHSLRWGIAFAGVLVAVQVCGEARLSLAARRSDVPTVKVAGITAPAALRAEAQKQITMENSPPSEQTEAAVSTPAMRALYGKVADELMRATRRAASAGAQVIVWSETAAPVLETDKPTLLQMIGELARSSGVYVNAAVGVPFERNETFLFDSSGAQVWHYQKNHPVPGIEPVAPVSNRVPVANTPVGHLSNLICYDGDFPALARVPADIMLVPAWDWREIGYTHTMKMARMRAIENGYSLFRVDHQGVTAAFDPYGRVLAMQDTLAGQGHTLIVDLPRRGVSTVYGQIGDAFAWLCVAIALGCCGMAIFRPEREGLPGILTETFRPKPRCVGH